MRPDRLPLNFEHPNALPGYPATLSYSLFISMFTVILAYLINMDVIFTMN